MPVGLGGMPETEKEKGTPCNQIKKKDNNNKNKKTGDIRTDVMPWRSHRNGRAVGFALNWVTRENAQT